MYVVVYVLGTGKKAYRRHPIGHRGQKLMFVDRCR